VLTHEAIIDAEWDDQIKPLLLERFPNATPEQLREAQAYVYGGCVIQDMGYYPCGNRFFSHLTHYVRSGDFVQALFEESRHINDNVFALGTLLTMSRTLTVIPCPASVSRLKGEVWRLDDVAGKSFWPSLPIVNRRAKSFRK
jgi:hypothetical protein